MNIAFLWLVSVPIFILAYFIYGNYLARQIGLDENRKTPAVAINDQIDYLPTKPWVLFGHHFASIAGAGPIVGPTVALLYGYLPVWLWVVIGAIFIGAVHDFSALLVSVRAGGRSMAEIAGQTLGKAGFVLFISFTIMMLILVTSAFLGLTAKALTSLAPLDTLGLDSSQKILKTVLVEGKELAKIGGIASTSMILMTLFAPLVGYLLYRRNFNVILMSLLAILIAVFSIVLGFIYPLSLDYRVWMVMLSFYSFLAAGIPVWLILQPRDFTNVHLLYTGIFLLSLGILGAGILGVNLSLPANNLWQANNHPGLGFIWPVLFITVACGAISGFHALVAGGTSSKQLEKESQAKLIGFGAMLLEGILAICVLLVVAGGLKFNEYLSIVFPADLSHSNPILAFSLGTAKILERGLKIPSALGVIFGILMIEGFIVTSLDTAVRLNRYLFEELWTALFRKPFRLLRSYLFNSALSVSLMFYLGYTNAYITIWPIFGTANQLLAALTLIAVSAWLLVRGKAAWFTILPALFMLTTTFFSLLLLLFNKYLPAGNYPLILVDLLLIGLSVGLLAKVIQLLVNIRKKNYSEVGKLIHRQEEDSLAGELHLG